MADQAQYFVQWRGGKQGPWDLTTIRAALRSGEIHSMYQIESGGQWQPLREFLEGQPTTNIESSWTTEPSAAPQVPHEQEMQNSWRSHRLRSKLSQAARSEHMEWRHVGIALLLLLGIAAGGFGSCAIVKAVTAPAVEGKSASASR